MIKKVKKCFSKCFKKYKGELKQAMKDLKSKDTIYKQIPNILTFLRLVLAIPAGILYYFNPILSILLIGSLWVTDAIDGKLARKYGIQSKLGADMDTVADKLMFLGSVIPLFASLPFLVLNFLLEGAISGINLYGRFKGLDTRTVTSGKVKTVCLALTLIFGYLNYLIPVNRLILVSLIGLTSIFQTIAINDYVEQYEELSREANEKEDIEFMKKRQEELSKEEVLTKNSDKIKEYKNIRSLVLGTQLPNKKYTGKRKVRKMMQEKKNILD